MLVLFCLLQVTAQYHAAIQTERAKVVARGGPAHMFESSCLVHCGKGHSQIADWRQEAACVADTSSWLAGGCAAGAGGQQAVRCDSIAWVSRHSRVSAPAELSWLPGSTAARVKQDGPNGQCVHSDTALITQPCTFRGQFIITAQC